mmetsp:Transcript_10248/g.11139  ORF Transcript_10248/g.11139 Transcript_10248/m.11139 type:complete len:131 (-) Transcript_10248:97-489(-)
MSIGQEHVNQYMLYLLRAQEPHELEEEFIRKMKIKERFQRPLWALYAGTIFSFTPYYSKVLGMRKSIFRLGLVGQLLFFQYRLRKTIVSEKEFFDLMRMRSALDYIKEEKQEMPNLTTNQVESVDPKQAA